MTASIELAKGHCCIYVYVYNLSKPVFLEIAPGDGSCEMNMKFTRVLYLA